MDVVKIILGISGSLALLAFVWLVIRLIPVLRELRGTAEKFQRMADEEISPLIAQVRELVEETRPKIDDITQKIASMTEDEIRPMTSNVKDITTTVNGIVGTVGDMVSRTHEVVSLYQNKAVIPAIEVISIWDGIRRGASVLFGREDNGGGDQSG